MKNPLKRKKIKTLKDRLDEEEARIRKYLSDFLDHRSRIERLDKLYPNLINYVDLFIRKTITLRDDEEIPDEFLCSCNLLGLKVKSVDKKLSYGTGSEFYRQIEFEDKVNTSNC